MGVAGSGMPHQRGGRALGRWGRGAPRPGYEPLAVYPLHPAFEDIVVGVGVGQGVARDQPGQLAGAVDGFQIAALEILGAHCPRAAVLAAGWRVGQQGLVVPLGVLEPPGLFFGIHSTRRLDCRGEGNPPQADRSLDGGEVAFDKPDKRAEPGIRPADVLAKQGRVGAVAAVGGIGGLDPGRQAGDAEVDGVARTGQGEHDLEQPLGFFFPTQTVVALPPAPRAAVLRAARHTVGRIHRIANLAPPVEPRNPPLEAWLETTALPTPERGTFSLGCVCAGHVLLDGNVSPSWPEASLFADGNCPS